MPKEIDVSFLAQELLERYRFNHNRIGRLAVKLNVVKDDELRKLYEDDIRTLTKLEKKLETKLQTFSDKYPREGLILTLFYLDNKTLKEIGKEMHYELQTISIIKKDALNKINELWDKL